MVEARPWTTVEHAEQVKEHKVLVAIRERRSKCTAFIINYGDMYGCKLEYSFSECQLKLISENN